uniref:G_PROTEIN_RECEP_F1_2 domain-containing protein n=1 Tax=Caenorhabditis tropicalis TaxID=1561998 RepID=A0A1I7U0L0_9PELO
MNNSTTEAFVMMHSTSEVIEMFYQLAFFIIGTPINIFAFVKTSRSPLSSYRTGANRVNWLITLAWVFAIVCASPMSILRGIIQINDEDMYQCYPRTDVGIIMFVMESHVTTFQVFNEDILIAFNLFHVITSFYIPLFIVIICYLAIGFSIRKQMAERRLLQVLALLRIVCISESCQEIVSKLNWLQAIIIASTCINPFLYRFGTEPKRNSYYCSTMDTAGSRSVRRSTTVREAEAQRVAAAANRARERVEPNNAATVSPRDTRATVREQARVPNRLKNTKSNEV